MWLSFEVNSIKLLKYLVYNSCRLLSKIKKNGYQSPFFDILYICIKTTSIQRFYFRSLGR